MRRRLGLLVLLTALVAAATAADAAARLPTLWGAFTRPYFQVRPGRIVYTGDGSGILGGPRGRRHRFGTLTWHRWTTRDAYATGVVWLDDCRPNCAQGTYHGFGARVNAFRPRRGHFTRLTIRYRHDGRRIVDRRRLVRLTNGYAW